MATEVLLSAIQMAKLLDLKTSNADLWVAPDSLGSAEMHSPGASQIQCSFPKKLDEAHDPWVEILVC
ncbi:MAG TPA: hypothetical protein VKE98_02665 [Gemmataceae bacterium]|nr:hypothetical protein [Gemmataceae bacterium]